MKLLIDSSVFIAFLNDADIFHEASVVFLQRLSEDKNIAVVLPILVFLEVANVLNRKIGAFDEERLLQSFNKYEKIDLHFDSSKDLLSLFKLVNMKTSDAIIFATAKLTVATLITWDEKFQKEAKKFVKIQTPKTFLSKTAHKNKNLLIL